jgi:hypothetical protein
LDRSLTGATRDWVDEGITTPDQREATLDHERAEASQSLASVLYAIAGLLLHCRACFA